MVGVTIDENVVDSSLDTSVKLVVIVVGLKAYGNVPVVGVATDENISSGFRVDWTLTIVVASNIVVIVVCKVDDADILEVEDIEVVLIVDFAVVVVVGASCGSGASSGAVASAGASSASFVVVVVASCNGNVEPSAP